ncbi:unnamed protein product [Mytilus edulis]|uniref:Uncharacterized protein n=1 Tax=Mytilus edulis TaxID=6550 RepID=A0A8S3UX08_MYTED|nr:unnamed protein product [Mytilus edulis]
MDRNRLKKREQQYCTKESHKANNEDCRTWTGQTPEILAEAEFFYKDGVRLQGYKCKIVTSNQNIGSYPFEEHGRISPNCNHVKMKESKQQTFDKKCEEKHTLLIEDFDPADISDYTVVISDNSCSQKLQFDAKTFPSVVVSCSPGYLWQKLGYETAQKPSTTQEYTYPVSDADTFDKHKKNGVTIRTERHCKGVPFQMASQIINPSPGKVIPANSMRLHSKIVQLGRSFTYFSRLIAFLPKGTKQAVCYGNDLVIISPECENVTCTENDCVVICEHGKSICCYKNSLAICSVKCDNVLLENNEIQVSVSFYHQSFINQNFGLLL